MDKEQLAIARLQDAARLSEHRYKKPLMVTYSGGKDSQVLVALAERAGINFEVVNSHTTADAPETVYFIREQFKAMEERGIKCSIAKGRKMKKFFLTIALLASLLLCSCGSEADKANYNISKQADYFESERKITVYNARTDTVILEAEGYMSISNNSNNELVCTVKIGPDTYRKNYIYLNDYTMYVVEDITGTHTDPYHYKLYFHTDILPSVEAKS